jgi:hypothetical protein
MSKVISIQSSQIYQEYIKFSYVNIDNINHFGNILRIIYFSHRYSQCFAKKSSKDYNDIDDYFLPQENIRNFSIIAHVDHGKNKSSYKLNFF